MEKDVMILAENQYYSLDCYETQLNNNVLVVGASGSGKTRSIVVPNLLQATGSYIVSDPKGNLYNKYKNYLIKRGYVVKKLDFINPKSSDHYNPLSYVRSEQDIIKLAHMIMMQNTKNRTFDPFWDDAAELLLQALISLVIEEAPKEEQNLQVVLEMISACQIDEDDSEAKTALDLMIDELEEEKPDSFAVKQYKKFRVAAAKTLKSILITLNAKIGAYDTRELQEMMKIDDIDIASIGQRKTALFVGVSDSERSMDKLANIFFTQAMNELCRYADENCADNFLPVPVRFILDDFATNCVIEEFPRMISSIRSRGISAMLMIQAESQLREKYGYDGRTIIGNCDTYVYLGGNDVETAQEVAKRCDLPLHKILNMPIGTNWIFRRGQEPVNGKNFDLKQFIREKEINEDMVIKKIVYML